jgi:hypothetical protein
LHAGEDVSVDLHGEGDTGVTEAFNDNEERFAEAMCTTAA